MQHLDRRAILAGLSASMLAPRLALADTVMDGAGRSIAVPGTVARVFPAGPPAAIFIRRIAMTR